MKSRRGSVKVGMGGEDRDGRRQMGYVARKEKNKLHEEKGERLGCGRCLEFGGERNNVCTRVERAGPIPFCPLVKR